MSPTIIKMEVWPIAGYDCMELNLSGAHAPHFTRDVVVLHGDNGEIGVGEVPGGQKIMKALGECIPPVVGTKVAEYESMLLKAEKHLEEKGEEGVRGNQTFDLCTGVHVVTAIGASCLDLLGKHLGVPVCELLGEGRQRDKVRMLGYLFFAGDRGKTDLPYLPEPNSDCEWYRVYHKRALIAEPIVASAKTIEEKYGFEDSKLKSGAFPGNKEMDVIRALKKEFPHTGIDLDPNDGWLLEQAVKYVEGMQGILTYCGDPYGAEGAYSGCEIVSGFRRHTGFPTATNMTATDWRKIEHSLELQAVDIILADPHFWTMAGLARVGQMRHDFDYIWGSHSNSHFGIPLVMFTQVGTVVPGGYNALDTHWVWQEGPERLTKEPFQVVDGYVATPKKSGLGVEVNIDQIKKVSQSYLENCLRVRNDTTGMQYLVPSWKFDPRRPCPVG